MRQFYTKSEFLIDSYGERAPIMLYLFSISKIPAETKMINQGRLARNHASAETGGKKARPKPANELSGTQTASLKTLTRPILCNAFFRPVSAKTLF